MSNRFIAGVREFVLDKKDLRRWVKILNDDPTLGLPAVEVEVSLITDSTLMQLARPFRSSKKDAGEIDLQKEKKFRSAFLCSSVTGWKGICAPNLRRMSEQFLAHPELFEDANDITDWEFDKQDLAYIAENINVEYFNKIMDAATNLEEFSQEVISKAKN